MYDPANDVMPPFQKEITIPQLIAIIRRKLRDFEDLNRLTKGVESKDEDILQAIRLAFSYANNTPPLIIQQFTYQSPMPLHLLIDLVIVEIVKSLIFYHIRNGLTANDGNLTFTTDKSDKWLMYLNMLKNDVESKFTSYKIARNMEEGMGGSLPSEYAILSGSLLYTL
jgi:hypothetical protein